MSRDVEVSQMGYYFECCQRWFPWNHHFCVAAMRRDPFVEKPGPKTFRKRPVVIEAMRFQKPQQEEVARWCGGELRFDFGFGEPVYRLNILTLEGAMVAREGDWIVKGTAGEFYPVKPDIFAETYVEG